MAATIFALALSAAILCDVAGQDDVCADHHGETSTCLIQKGRIQTMQVGSLPDIDQATQLLAAGPTQTLRLDRQIFVIARDISTFASEIPKSCPRIYLAIPLGTFCLILSVVMAWHGFTKSDAMSSSELARRVGLFAQFCGLSNYSIIIIEAYQLSQKLHRGAGFSGRLIGTYMATAVVGSLITSGLLRVSPTIWKTNARQVFVIAQILSMIGFFLYASVTSYMTHNDLSNPEHVQYLATTLLAARATSGAGQGMSSTLLRVTFAYTVPKHERPAQMTIFALVSTLGIGLGPIVAACLRLLDFCPAGGPPRYELTGLAQFMSSGFALIGVIAFYPRLDDVEDFSQDSNLASLRLGPEPSYTKQTCIVCGCILTTFLRAMVTSGVEGATSLLLETEYKFELYQIGIIIGATFLCCLPFKFMMDHIRERFTVFEWIRALCSMSFVGSCLLFRRSWQSLVLADVLLFPSLYLSDGMLQGLMQQHALPDGKLFDQTGSTFLAMLLHSAGRFFGPWIARILLDKVNQTGYAALQIMLVVAFWVIAEILVIKPAGAVECQIQDEVQSPRRVRRCAVQ